LRGDEGSVWRNKVWIEECIVVTSDV